MLHLAFTTILLQTKTIFDRYFLILESFLLQSSSILFGRFSNYQKSVAVYGVNGWAEEQWTMYQ